MSDSTGEYRILTARLRKTLSLFGVRIHDWPEDEPLPEQAYRLLTLLGSLAHWRRMHVAQDAPGLNIATKRDIMASSYRIVSGGEDVGFEAACERITESMALLAADMDDSDDGSPQALINTLLSAIGLLLTALGLDDVHGAPYMDGEEPYVIPGVETLVADARDRVRNALEQLDHVLEQPSR